MSDEPINVLSRRLSKFFTNNKSSAFDYQRYRERESSDRSFYRTDQKSFKCICLSNTQHRAPSLVGHFTDSVKLSDNGIKKSKIKIWFVGDDSWMNGTNGNPLTETDENLKNAYILTSTSAIVTKSFDNISADDLLTVEERDGVFYVTHHHSDEELKYYISNTTNTTTPSASSTYKNSPSGLISKLSNFITLPPIGEPANEIVKAYPNSRPIANQIVAVAERLNTNPFWLANLINFETKGTFSSTVKNPGSTAVGLIQFMDFTAAELLGLDPGPKGSKNRKESRQKFLEMSSKEQMKWVEIYLKRYSSTGFPSVTDLYMAVFFPIAIGKGPNYSIYNWYLQNEGLSSAEHFKKVNPGILTAGDYARFANKNAKLPTGLS